MLTITTTITSSNPTTCCCLLKAALARLIHVVRNRGQMIGSWGQICQIITICCLLLLASIVVDHIVGSVIFRATLWKQIPVLTTHALLHRKWVRYCAAFYFFLIQDPPSWRTDCHICCWILGVWRSKRRRIWNYLWLILIVLLGCGVTTLTDLVVCHAIINSRHALFGNYDCTSIFFVIREWASSFIAMVMVIVMKRSLLR